MRPRLFGGSIAYRPVHPLVCFAGFISYTLDQMNEYGELIPTPIKESVWSVRPVETGEKGREEVLDALMFSTWFAGPGYALSLLDD